MSGSLTSASFWVDTGERAVRSFAQGVLSASGLGVAGQFVPAHVSVPWLAALSFGGVLALVSVLTSLASITIPATGSFLAPPPSQALRLRTLWKKRR